MVALPLQAESTLTDRYQTTVPDTVRKALRLGRRDKIHYTIQPNGHVLIARSDSEEDPALGGFLNFLAKDMIDHPHRIQAMDPKMIARIKKLTAGVKIDLNAPLAAEDE